MGALETIPKNQPKQAYRRISFLYQAATYLASCRSENNDIQKVSNSHDMDPTAAKEEELDNQGCDLPIYKQQPGLSGLSRHMVSHLKSVALRAQVRQASPMKRSMCKFCNRIHLTSGSTISYIENRSKGGRKPWADTLITDCECGALKRIPVSTSRQKSSKARKRRELETESKHATHAEPPETFNSETVHTNKPDILKSTKDSF